MLKLQPSFPGLQLDILATDADPVLLGRARQACYPYSAIKNLPADWREQAFLQDAEQFCLKARYRQPVRFAQQDFRVAMPREQFDLVLCRNLVFTYFVEPQQCEILQRLRAAIRPGGALLIGIHEKLPACSGDLDIWSERFRVYRRANEPVCE